MPHITEKETGMFSRRATLAGWLWMVGFILVGCMAHQRGPSDFVDDNLIAMKIRSTFVESEDVKAGNINVTVYKGKVLLTGTGASDEEIQEAVRLAKETPGVTRVASELKVQYASTADIAHDSLISNKVKMRLLADERVSGMNIHVETTKGVVYLTGTASTVRERDRAVNIARHVAGVEEVVSYIEVAYPRSESRVREPAPARKGQFAMARKR
jgi:osmotically-inducible protein OsmY